MQSSLSGVGYKSVEGVATKDDWLVLLMGGRERKFNKGDVVLAKGQKREGIFQISSGSCRIEVDAPDGSKKVVGKMNMDEVCQTLSKWLETVATHPPLTTLHTLA